MTSALLSAAAVLAAILAGAGEDEPRTPPVFAVSIDTVKLDVSVTRGGQFVEGLVGDDFEVKDDGVVQDVELVSGDERALQAVLVLDTSSSVAGPRLESLKTAASSFIADLSPADAVSVIAFSHRVYALSADPYDHERLRVAVEDLTAGGATALNDAAVAGLLRSDTGRGRPMVLIFSDGENRLSWLGRRHVLQAARGLDAVVYGVVATSGVGDEAAYALSFFRRKRGRERRTRADLLRELADLTGGAVLQTAGGDFAAAFRRILAAVQSRYVLRYVPRGVKETGWHRIQVRLRRGSGQVKVRRGYRR